MENKMQARRNFAHKSDNDIIIRASGGYCASVRWTQNTSGAGVWSVNNSVRATTHWTFRGAMQRVARDTQGKELYFCATWKKQDDVWMRVGTETAIDQSLRMVTF